MTAIVGKAVSCPDAPFAAFRLPFAAFALLDLRLARQTAAGPSLHREHTMSILRSFRLNFLAISLAPLPFSAHALSAQHGSLTATAPLDTAIARMGNIDSLRALRSVRFDVMTQWQRAVFDGRRYADQPIYEWNTDLRDYTTSSWRNTRRYFAVGKWSDIADVVNDTIAIRRSAGGYGGVGSPFTVAAGDWAPLNIAYVDERRELFAMAPERVLLSARSANDLRSLPDTTLDGVSHARVVATVDGFRTTLFLRRTDGMLAVASFRTSETNDFGLVQWGEMNVEFWYSSWRKQSNGIYYPLELDVRRFGQAYKRMTVLAATMNPVAPADSFAVSDSLRSLFLRTSTRPMHDLPLDSARFVEPRLVSFATPGAPVGAVKLGRRWVLLEGGFAPLNAQHASSWLMGKDPGASLVAALLSQSSSGSGGAAWLATNDISVLVAPGGMRPVSLSLSGYRAKQNGVSGVKSGRWLVADHDSLWVEPIDLPDAPGSLVAYVPSLNWVYSSAASGPLQLDMILAHAKAAGWHVARYGSARAIVTPLPVALQISTAAQH